MSNAHDISFEKALLLNTTSLTREDYLKMEAFAQVLAVKMGIRPIIITAAEIKKRYGKTFYERALNAKEIEWFRKGGRTSSPYCERTKFEAWLLKTE